MKLQKGGKQMPKVYKTGRSNSTGVVTIKAEHLIRSGINIGDEIQISVNSRKEIVIRKVTK
jgi:antitoxin component of MazEF toxin-antitoxin module